MAMPPRKPRTPPPSSIQRWGLRWASSRRQAGRARARRRGRASAGGAPWAASVVLAIGSGNAEQRAEVVRRVVLPTMTPSASTQAWAPKEAGAVRQRTRPATGRAAGRAARWPTTGPGTPRDAQARLTATTASRAALAWSKVAGLAPRRSQPRTVRMRRGSGWRAAGRPHGQVDDDPAPQGHRTGLMEDGFRHAHDAGCSFTSPAARSSPTRASTSRPAVAASTAYCSVSSARPGPRSLRPAASAAPGRRSG